MAQELITYGTDRRLVLGNGQGVRKFIYGNTWTTIRIGLRCSFVDVTADIGGGPLLVFGVASGDTAVWAEGTSTHVIGARIGGSGTMKYTAGPPKVLDHNTASCPMRFIKRIGTTVTASAAALTWFASAGETVRSGMFLEIVKGSPNYSFRMAIAGTVAGAQSDLTDAEYDTIMEIASLATVATVKANYNDTGLVTLAVSEADGALDNFFCFWERTAQRFSFDVKHRSVA